MKKQLATKLITAYLVGAAMTLAGLQIALAVPIADAQHKEHPNPGKDAKGGAPYAQKKEHPVSGNPIVVFFRGLFTPTH